MTDNEKMPMKITDDNRDQIIENYVRKIIDSMDMDGLLECLEFYMIESNRRYTNEQLETEINETYPELLENQ